MLDDSFLYQKDFEKHLRDFKNKDLVELYKGLYFNARLSYDTDDPAAQIDEGFLENYSNNVKIINELVKENYQLQHRVHQLGIKNRIRSKLGRYRPPEIIKNYLTPNELEDVLNGTFVSKNILSLETFSRQSLKVLKNLSDESFESGLRKIQNEIGKPRISNPPLVSIIIPSRNGLNHFTRLLSNIEQLTEYPNYEIIIVDNASTDGTIEYLNKFKSKLNLQIIRNTENKSFSESNNMAVKKSKGSYLLFLNNDVSPTDGWLTHMVSTVIKDPTIGAVGAKLIYPYKPGFENSYKIQHGGLGFKLENNFIRPINLGVGANFFARNTKREEEKAGVTAACLLIERTKYEEIEGFDEAYWYGYEDVDLCLKLRDKGYRNVINNAAVLFHHEFGTQDKIKSDTISGYRKKNMEIFKNKWQKKIYPEIWKSLLKNDAIYSDKQLHIGFVVTEASSKTAAGDYYTAKELGDALVEKGCKTSYIGIRHATDPYNIDPDMDVLISMIDGYDISQITQPKVTKIAWCRNWFERWANHDYIRDFDIILTNSEKSQQFFKNEHHLDSFLFKIATNKQRFTKKYAPEELVEFESDITFTGNFWHVPRDISSLFDTEKFKDRYKIKIFGKDWDHVKALKPYWQGFLEYKNIPKVYAASKILIDDATFVVNKWGSVNSRVFDGAASGVLVFTNGIEGSKNTFDGLVPTFSTKEELSELIEKYLSDDNLRQKKINEIRQFVLSHHTYEHRATELLQILNDELTKKVINIKLPIPRWSEAKNWGDLHFGQGLKRELEQLGYDVKLQILPEWDKSNFAYANIVLRGLSVFNPPADQINLMWNISHPEKVPVDEYKSYDYAFVASSKHVENLKKKGLSNVHVLYQCYDDFAFNDEPSKDPGKYKSDILFVGNTRNHYRRIVKDILSWKALNKYGFKVYGSGWDKFISKKYIAGEHIENSALKYHYQNTKVLLNDHWDDMNEYEFVSNRLFDASACGAFIISDSNPGIKEIFGSNVIEEYSDAASLHQLLDIYLNDSHKRSERSNKAKTIVTNDHSFKSRAARILLIVDEL